VRLKELRVAANFSRAGPGGAAERLCACKGPWRVAGE